MECARVLRKTTFEPSEGPAALGVVFIFDGEKETLKVLPFKHIADLWKNLPAHEQCECQKCAPRAPHPERSLGKHAFRHADICSHAGAENANRHQPSARPSVRSPHMCTVNSQCSHYFLIVCVMCARNQRHANIKVV